jgi:glutamyl-tRNA synthetase
LRIDDLDSERCRPEFLDDIFASLEWLGIEPDEGPSGADEFLSGWSQHHRLDVYDRLLRQILENSNLIFACSCTRSQLPAGPYPGTCTDKSIPLDEPSASWRIKLREPFIFKFDDLLAGNKTVDVSAETGAFVVRGKNGRPAYQVASLADDLHFNINCVVRGSDLLPSTGCQLYLDHVAEINRFGNARFLHHPLVTGADQLKLSKSKGAASLKSIRESGGEPHSVYRIVADWLDCSLRSTEISGMRQELAEMIEKKFPKIHSAS